MIAISFQGKMKTYSFEKLAVWRKARELNKNIYSLSESFGKEELFGLISQIRRASISVASNLAEGASRKSSKEQSRFYSIAYSSLIEVLCQLILAKDLGKLNELQLKEQRTAIDELAKGIQYLRRSITQQTP